jgi:small subunit ribosomal protein S20
MANHPSAEKRNRQRIKRTETTRSVRSTTRTAVRKAREAIAEGKPDAAKAQVLAASVALAKAAKKGVLHPRAASRTTARIAGALHRIGKPAS